MIFPDDPKERKKMFLAFGIMGASLIYLAVNYGMRPLIEKQKNRAEQVKQLEDLVFKAQRKIKKLDGYREQLTTYQTEVLDASERQQHVLHHNLGNYRLVAESIVLPYLKQAGLRVASTSPAPWKEKLETEVSAEGIPKGRRFVAYGLNASCSGSFMNLIAAIDALEASNPYLSVSSITARHTSDAPRVQNFQLLIEWPIWASDEIKLAITLSAASEQS
jgi:hypothetical protein